MNTDNYLEEMQLSQKMILAITGSEALAKSCSDDFDYAMKLRTGEVIRYCSADLINNEWIHVRIKDSSDQPSDNRIAYPADRGVDIRISEIVWVMDAPEGS